MLVRAAMVVAAGITAMVPFGCAGPEATIATVQQQLGQIPLGANKDVVRFVLGFPARESADLQSWWYLAPWPVPARGSDTGYSLLCRFDAKGILVLREWLAVVRTRQDDEVRLQYEALSSSQAHEQAEEFVATLQDKLAELTRVRGDYRLDQQPASFQLRMGEHLLITMERWTRGTSQLVRVHGRFSAAAHPQLLRAVQVARGVRRFSIELLFEPVPGAAPTAQSSPTSRARRELEKSQPRYAPATRPTT